MFVCSICNYFGGQSFSSVLRHIGEVHRFDPGLVIRCGIDRCPETYKNFESFRSHVYRKHRDVIHPVSMPTSDHVETSQMELPVFTEEHIEHSFPQQSASSSLCSNWAKFLLKTREEYCICQATVNKIAADVNGLWIQSLQSVKQKVKECIEKTEASAKKIEVESLMECFENSSPLESLKTEHMQEKYLKENFVYLEPVERVLGREMTERNGKYFEEIECCYDIGLLDSLQCMFQMDVVREQITSSHSMCNGMLGDYCDGELFQSNKLFQEDPSALQLQLYFDELEICNPLGSKAKKHKLGFLYYTLGNLDPKLRSSLKSIYLLSVVKHEYIIKYGIDEMLKPVVQDILKLEKDEGVQFEFDGQPVTCRGTVTVFSADNLAAWAVGGYKSLASAFRKCQYCMVTDEEMQTQFTEHNLQCRTKEIYEAHCASLGGPLNDHIATTYGIVRNSVLNELNYFHVVTGLVPDIMHNILEGTLELTIRHFLIQCISVDNLFPIKLLNDRLRSFYYGPEITNKPTPLSIHHIAANSHIKQSASQMWCLGRFLPLLIGDLISEDYQYWDNYLTHLEIIDEVFAPITSIERADYVGMLIEDFLEEFKFLYPERPLTPKMHYLVHIPTWMKRCGPLIRVWCMRYEAKHSFFKHVSQVVRNFRNIPKTLAVRHQRYMCYQMLEPCNYLQHHCSYTRVRSVRVEDMEHHEQIMTAAPELSKESTVWRASSVTLNGTTYRKDMIIVHDVKDEEPVFHRITDILETPTEETLFVAHCLKTVCFNRHYHAFEVELSPTFVVYTHCQFKDHHPLHICKSFGTNRAMFVCLKYHIYSP